MKMATSLSGVGTRKHDYLLQDSSLSVILQLADVVGVVVAAVYNVTVSKELECVCNSL
jgi:hypothetical protein